jgi:hypothetical protein
MAEKTKTEKPIRVQFQKDVTAEGILSEIKKLQDEWAKKDPARAHRLYPNVYDEKGDRIKAS